MIRYRNAKLNDLDELLSLIKISFSKNNNSQNGWNVGEEHRILFSYLYGLDHWKPEWVYLGSEDGNLVTAVGVFPQQLSFDGQYIPVWAVSPVVTHPDHRGKGAAAGCLEYMFKDLRDQGINAVYLWGIPNYYPKFGFVPILPRYKTKLFMGNLPKISLAKGKLRIIDEKKDLNGVISLYQSQEKSHWLQPLRTPEWWKKRFDEFDIDEAIAKEVPFPKKDNLVVWENSCGEVSGYLNYIEETDKNRIVINEASALNIESAQSFLYTFINERNYLNKTIMVRGTPFHLLNKAAYRFGGIHMNPAPFAGMIKVLDWTAFIRSLSPVLYQRLLSLSVAKSFTVTLDKDLDIQLQFDRDDSGLEISFKNGIESNLVKINRNLTELVMGLSDYSKTEVETDPVIRLIFPPKFPFIWDANYLY